jgi:hypothetical protein
MKKILPIITIFVLLTPVYLGLAQGEVQPPITNPEEYTQSGLVEENPEQTIAKVFDIIFRISLILASVFTVVMFILAGLMYITGWGGGADKAKGKLIWGAVGLVIALVSYAVVALLARFVQTGQTR